MSVFRRAMSYLGLGPDDAYDDYDLPPEPERVPRGRTSQSYDSDVAVHPVSTRQTRPPEPYGDTRASSSGGYEPDPSGITVRGRQGSAVRPVAASAPRAPHTVRPRHFDHAKEVGDTFRAGQPVIVNLQDIDRDLSRRLIDFASGLCYALDGKLDRVAQGVYLLTPSSISADEHRQLKERGYD
jgi:cell division inhibitor SepF